MRQKVISILALLLMAATGATAQTAPQVPNGDFETWTFDGANLPNNWNSYSTGEGNYIKAMGKGGVTRSTDVRPGSAGQYSCDIYSGSTMGIVAVGNLTSGRIVLGAMSASNSANYNYSDRDGSNTNNEVVNPCAMRFTGKPKAVKVWVKFTQGTTQTTYKYAKFSAIIHSDADYKAYNNASHDNDANKALVVASAVKDDIESNGGEWQELTIPFEYTENAVEPAYILINAYTNTTPGKGSSNTIDHLYIDDIEMVYDLALDETTDNTAKLTDWNDIKADVTLTRTLQTGGWNTFCAPFSTATPSGWTVKELSSSAFDSSTGELTLNFGNAASIEAGKPYLVKVTANVENPVFEGVTVSSTATTTETTAVDFVPTLGLTEITGDDANDILFVGSGNTLLHPTALPANMKGFRAYFLLKGEAALARAFRMDFGDGETTGIISIENAQPATSSAVYDLQGRRINSTAQKGVYIVNGKKTVIK
ncbi:MAG: hypothetical protein IJ533_09790 [Prevotella sp.]|nr:hypothetical protein [Prevotella sp.]